MRFFKSNMSEIKISMNKAEGTHDSEQSTFSPCEGVRPDSNHSLQPMGAILPLPWALLLARPHQK